MKDDQVDEETARGEREVFRTGNDRLTQHRLRRMMARSAVRTVAGRAG